MGGEQNVGSGLVIVIENEGLWKRKVMGWLYANAYQVDGPQQR